MASGLQEARSLPPTGLSVTYRIRPVTTALLKS
jgi:hypothetical protein